MMKRGGGGQLGGRRFKVGRKDVAVAFKPPEPKKPPPSQRPRKSNPAPKFKPPAPGVRKPPPPEPKPPRKAAAAPAPPSKNELMVDTYLAPAIKKLLPALEKRNSRGHDAFLGAIRSKKKRVIVVSSPKGCGGAELVVGWITKLKRKPVLRSIVTTDRDMGMSDLLRAAGGGSAQARSERILVITDLEQSRTEMVAELEKTLDKMVIVVHDAFDKSLRGALFGETRETVMIRSCAADELARAAERAMPVGGVPGGFGRLKREAAVCEGNMSALLCKVGGGGSSMNARFDLFSEASGALLTGKTGVEGRYAGEEPRNLMWVATPVVAEVYPRRNRTEQIQSIEALSAALDDHSLGDTISREGWRSGCGVLNAYADEIAVRTLHCNRVQAGIQRPVGHPKSFYKSMGARVREFNTAKRQGIVSKPTKYGLVGGQGFRALEDTEEIRPFKWVYTPIHDDPVTDAIVAMATAVADVPGWVLGPSDKTVSMVPPPPISHPEELAWWFQLRYPGATTLVDGAWWPGAWAAALAGLGPEHQFSPHKYVKDLLNAAIKIAPTLPKPPRYAECARHDAAKSLDRPFSEVMRVYLRRIEF